MRLIASCTWMRKAGAPASSRTGQSRAGVRLFWARAGAGAHTRAVFQDLQPWRVRRVAVDAFAAKARRRGLAA